MDACGGGRGLCVYSVVFDGLVKWGEVDSC